MKAVAFTLSLLIAAPAFAQDTQSDRVMKAVRAAMAAALPFPETDASDEVPVNNNTESLWMIRRYQGDQTIDVFSNPLNLVVQQRATRAMAQIEANIQAAQRRAEVQYEAAVAEAKRTGRSQEVDGVTLSDEGVAGERIDAESYASVFVEFREREYTYPVPGSMEPARVETFTHPDSLVFMTPGHTYKDATGAQRWAENHLIIVLGRNMAPNVTKERNGYVMKVVPTTPATAGLDSLSLHVHGNGELVSDILAKTNWAQLLELLK